LTDKITKFSVLPLQCSWSQETASIFLINLTIAAGKKGIQTPIVKYCTMNDGTIKNGSKPT